MSWIVVLESEGRPSESIRESLTEDGWQVESANTSSSAAAAITTRSPELVIANTELAGAAELLRRSARGQGGPGALALVAPGSGAREAAEAADEQLKRPFSDQDLRLAVRRLVTLGRAPKTPPESAPGERFTSQDLFGDVLAEVEGTPAAPLPAAAREAPAASALDRTLSDLMRPDKTEKARPAAARRDEPAVDDLLSRTLSGLDVQERPKRAAAAPAKPAPPKPAPPPPAEVRQATTPPAEKPAPPAAKPAPPAVKPPPPVPPRRAKRELDFSELDALAKPGRAGSDKTPTSPQAFATQKVAIPGMKKPAAGPLEFGQYTLLERIALGGMAEVWKARMKGVEGFQKTVAIKKILPHLTDSTDFVTMFIDEAKLAAQLNHNNIIHIYDLGKIGEDYYIAMEYVDGKDLRSILNAARDEKTPIPLGLALLVTSRLASALDHAHRQRDFEGRDLHLVHRDVSPQNVLISFDGDIKLCDFGIVKAVSKASKTQMGALKGKLQYMSPEQAWGRPVDARSDIFSLATLLFEMLTGQRLFTGESEMSVLDAVREGRIQAPRDLDPRIPLEVNALVLRALARDPGDRYQSAGEVQREIDAILGSLKPAPSQQELARYVRKLYGAGERPAAAEPRRAPAAEAQRAPVAPGAAARLEPDAHPLAAPAAEGAQPDAALEEAAGGGRNLLWIGIAAAVVLAVLGYVLLSGGGEESAAPAAESSAPPAVEAPAEAAPAPEAATPAPPREERAVESAAAAEEPAPEPVAEREAPAREAPKPATSAPAPAAAASEARAATPPAPEPPVVSTPIESVVASAPEPSPAPAPVPPAPPPAPAAPAPRPAAETAAPAAPLVREGDLVTYGPGVTAPVLVSVDKPSYPAMARRMKVEGTVNLSVLVDETGRVIDVRVESGVRQNVGLNEAAIETARSARFKPATKNGVRVKTWYRLTIPFKL